MNSIVDQLQCLEEGPPENLSDRDVFAQNRQNTSPNTRQVDIAFVSHTPAIYGANRSMLTLMLRQAQERSIALIGYPETSQLIADTDISNTPFWSVNLPWIRCHSYQLRPKYLLSRSLESMRAMGRLKSFAKSHSPKIVCSNSSTIVWGDYLARKCGAKHIWFLREYGDLDYGLRWSYPKFRFQQKLRKADAIVCVSNSVAKHHGVDSLPQTTVIYNGVVAKSDIRRLSLPNGELTFGMVGLLSEAKGFATGIRALAKLHSKGVKARLSIYGDGPQRDHLESLARELSITESVVFHGHVASPRTVFAKIDTLLVTSRCEAFGRTTAEAMCYGVPVIGRETGGTAELIDNEVNGLLFRESPDELAECMFRLCNDKTMAIQLSDAGLSKAMLEYSTETYAEKFNHIVESLV